MGKVKDIWLKIKPYIPNRYLLAIGIFCLLMLFAGKDNLIHRFRYNREARELKREIRRYEAQRDQAAEQLEDLRLGTQELEKIAREQYYMHAPDEDVFILEDR